MVDDSLHIYDNYRNELTLARQSSFEHFDRAILSLSSAGLGLSLAFLKDIVPLDEIAVLWLLFISWTLFSLSIMATLVSFVLARISIDKQLEYAEEYYVNRDESFFNKKNPYKLATTITNYISGICFLLAILMTVSFVSININIQVKEKRLMSKEQSPQEVPIQEGVVPANMQKVTPEPDLIRGIVPSKMPQAQPSQGTTPQSSEGGSKKSE